MRNFVFALGLIVALSSGLQAGNRGESEKRTETRDTSKPDERGADRVRDIDKGAGTGAGQTPAGDKRIEKIDRSDFRPPPPPPLKAGARCSPRTARCEFGWPPEPKSAVRVCVGAHEQHRTTVTISFSRK